MTGSLIDTYRVQDVLGRGGMGVVYKAVDTSLDKVVALKVMNPSLIHDEHFLSRFKSEARALGRLQHPNIVNVFTFRQTEQHLFLVMEFVDGGSLGDLIKQRGALPWQEALAIMEQSLAAIAYAHQQRIIHRDIKPANILISKRDVVKVTDFGLAKIQADTSSVMATRTGFTGGTLYYMPPEQLTGLSHVDHRGDIYSLGMTFFEMLAGRVPFDRSSSEFTILKAIDAHDFVPLGQLRADLPTPLVEIVTQMIARNPEDRYQSVQDVLAALQAWQSQPPQPDLEPPPASLEVTQVVPVKPKPDPVAPRPVSNKEPVAVSGPPPKKEKAVAGKKPEAPERASSRWPVWLAGGVAVALVIGFLAMWSFTGGTTLPASLAGSSPPVTEQQRLAENPNEAPLEPTGIDSAIDAPGLAQASGEETTVSQPEASQGEESPPAEVEDATQPPASIDEPTSPEVLATASLTVRSQPAGAGVWANNRRLGQTPFTTTTLNPGTHSLVLRKEGFQDQTQSVRVAAGDERAVDVALVPLTGRVRILARPFGDIYVDGTLKRENESAPYVEELAVGTYRIRVVHPIIGEWEKDVPVRAGDQDVLFNFNQRFNVLVTSEPRVARIIVDGTPTNEYTPAVVSLRPGTRRITVQKDGYEPEGDARTIMLENDRTEGDGPLHFVLRASQ